MDDMILTRTHLWAVHLVKHFITTRADKKVEPIYGHLFHLISCFLMLKGMASASDVNGPLQELRAAGLGYFWAS